MTSLVGDLIQRSEDIAELLWQLLPEADFERAEYRFPHGRIPTDLAEQAAGLVAQWDQLYREAPRLEAALENSHTAGSSSADSAITGAADPDLNLANAQGLVARAEQQLAVGVPLPMRREKVSREMAGPVGASIAARRRPWSVRRARSCRASSCMTPVAARSGSGYYLSNALCFGDF